MDFEELNVLLQCIPEEIQHFSLPPAVTEIEFFVANSVCGFQEDILVPLFFLGLLPCFFILKLQTGPSVQPSPM